MIRYVNFDDLERALEEESADVVADYGDYQSNAGYSLRLIREVVDRQIVSYPGRAFAPVVRCKDCKHAYVNQYAKEPGDIFCKHITNKTEGVIFFVQPNGFCSYGEKADAK